MASRLLDMVAERITYSGGVYVLGGAVIREYARFLTFEESAVIGGAGAAVDGADYDIHIENGAGWARAAMTWDRTAGTLTPSSAWLTVRRSDASPSTDAPDLTTGIATATVVLSANAQATLANLQDAVEDSEAAAVTAAAEAAAAAASAVIATSSSPIGSQVEWPFSTPPTNWLICDGSAVSRTLYPLLFALYNSHSLPFGAGDGTNTFNLPDYRGLFTIQADGSHALLTTGGSATTSAGGGHTHAITVANHTLTTAEMPAHTHPTFDATTAGSGGSGSGPANTQGGVTGSTGGGGAHNHTASSDTTAAHTHTLTPPYVALHRIVRAG